MNEYKTIMGRAREGFRVPADEALSLADCNDLPLLTEAAAEICERGHGAVVTYSPKVFIPLTHLCRDSCHYCTFAHPPKRGQRAYLGPEQVLEIAGAGLQAGCHEALFTLGDKPELRYKVARDELKTLGHTTTLSYLREAAQLVLDETGLLPHLNPGVLTGNDLLELRPVSVSQGLMLESSAHRLCEKAGPHYGSPDKLPATRTGTIAAAGVNRVPFTSGILIGIGETRRERIEALLALRELNDADGHIQEIIIQNFRRKAGTRMHNAEEPSLEDHLWTIAIARIIFGSEMNIQAPPNLMPHALPRLLEAGINDWGGISPVTPDHVNPEAAWPRLDELAEATEAAGKNLLARLPIYPEFLHDINKWVDAKLHTSIVRRIDANNYGRMDTWSPGVSHNVPVLKPVTLSAGYNSHIGRIVDRAVNGTRINEDEIVALFSAHGRDFEVIRTAADRLRAAVNGDTVSYVINRNINYTNICYYSCGFCAFSKGRVAVNLRERGYNLPLEEIQQRTVEAWHRGATEVCLQGGIHPDFTGDTYLAITAAVKQVQPGMHVHAFSPLEISHGAETLGMSVESYLQTLKHAGLGSLPGTAAEILDDEIRRIICPDKLDTREWLDVIRTAHKTGIRTTSTIMFGHVEKPVHWARHLLHLRDLQQETGGFTEFVPLPFVHMQAPLYRKGRARRGPTFRETILMHAVARLVLYPYINNIQASWVKLGRDGIKLCLNSGVNDLGGTLMDESISRAAGANHGQEFLPADMESLIVSAGRIPRQRNSLYAEPAKTQMASASGTGLNHPDQRAVLRVSS